MCARSDRSGSNDPSRDYLSDGLAEALIDALSRVNQLQVTARTSSFSFKDRPATIGEIARKLDVGAVLEGSLRRQGTHLRIDAHLSDARTGYQLWAHAYDLQTPDMLGLQDQIAGAVAEALQAKLLDTAPGGRSVGGTANPQAFDAYLRAEHDLRNGDFGQIDIPIAEFRRATVLDPDFALALVGLSTSLGLKATYLTSTADPAYRAMMAVAQRADEHAAAVAPDLGAPHAELAGVLLATTFDFSAAWAEALRGRALSPGEAVVQQKYGYIALAVGHREEAIRAAARAEALDPLDAESWSVMFHALDCAHKFSEAADALRRGVAVLGHAPSWAPFQLGSLLLKRGKADDARRICETSTEWTDICLAIAYHALGRQKDADTHMSELRAKHGDDDAYTYAEIYAQWKQPALAMHWLAKAREIKDPALAALECDAFLDPIRGQPGFREIEQSLHLPPRD